MKSENYRSYCFAYVTVDAGMWCLSAEAPCDCRYANSCPVLRSSESVPILWPTKGGSW